MRNANALFDAQFALAIGSMKVFRIDETGDDKSKKRVHVHVTNAEEIKALLDEHEGGNGSLNGAYYYIVDVLPDNRAIDSLLNRGIGKPAEHIKHEDAGSENLTVRSADALKVLVERTTGQKLSDEQAAQLMGDSFARAGITGNPDDLIG
jgi:hypothetical protein